MKINNRTEGGVYEVSFGYHSGLYGYTTLMSDILKLYTIMRECVDSEYIYDTQRIYGLKNIIIKAILDL